MVHAAAVLSRRLLDPPGTVPNSGLLGESRVEDLTEQRCCHGNLLQNVSKRPSDCDFIRHHVINDGAVTVEQLCVSLRHREA